MKGCTIHASDMRISNNIALGNISSWKQYEARIAFKIIYLNILQVAELINKFSVVNYKTGPRSTEFPAGRPAIQR